MGDIRKSYLVGLATDFSITFPFNRFIWCSVFPISVLFCPLFIVTYCVFIILSF